MSPIRRLNRGFSLPELMVAVAIGLVLTLTISTMVARQEAVRRGVTSGNDLTSNAAYASYLLDQELRSAGAGFSQAVSSNYSCRLLVSNNNTQLLPSPGAFPAPFASIPQAPVLAPLIVHAGAGAGGSDVIAVATGNSGLTESSVMLSPGTAAAGQVKLPNTLGMRGGDLVLVSQPRNTPPVNCMLQQVSAGFAGGAPEVLTFSGQYAANVINGVALADYAIGDTRVSVLGNVTGNRPKLELLGIDASSRLMAYDLLQLTAGTQQLVEGVVDMRVLYGVAAQPLAVLPAQRTVANWVAPTANGFTAAALSAGTPVAQNNLKSILAVRVGLVLRSDLVDKDDVTPASLTLFSDLPSAVQYTYTVPNGTKTQRYRTVEFTVPLRNVRYAR
ncbi:PilW family protein [Pelomonas cellulosilytica]|uniref:PilW family protein n=1 Tax=Pelomonas cellulosilytica TaxID=2906762 RepID=A0ABS8XQG1_9BURK|nr:PilW family protein [Pelomonas sp. P8]MCE4552831.1 PilW family protein [Pelomonas sp. P8]